LTATDTFVLNVRAVNDAPTLVDVVNQSSPEDEVAVVSVTVSDVDNLPGDLTVTAASSDLAVVASTGLAVTGTGTERTLTLRPLTNAVGTSTITLTVTDTNGAATSDTFVFTVTPVNDPPTLAQPSPVSVVEGSGSRVVTLTGISAGPTNEIQTLTVSAQSGDVALIPHPAVTYTSPATNASLTFTPVSGASGAVTLSVTVDDGGPSNRSITRSFVVTINSTNRLPVITGLADIATGEDVLTSVPFGISDLETAASDLVVRARSSNPAVVRDSSLTLSGEGTNRTLTLQPVAEQAGETFITLTVSDPDGGTNEQAFRLTVLAINDPPTLAFIDDLSLPPNAGRQTVGISNITSGAANEIQNLTVTAVSSEPAIIPHPTVTYTSPAQSGSLAFTPVPGVDTVVKITVTVNDGGATNARTVREFNVTVSTVNSPPLLATILPQVTLEDIALDVPLFLSDSNTPLANLTVTVGSSNTNLVPITNMVVLGTGAARTLRILPATNQVGTTTLSVRVSDPPGAFDTKTFVLTVLPVTDPPAIGTVADIVLNEDQPSGPINIPLISPEQEPSLLALTAVSLNTNLVPATGLALRARAPAASCN
jgi:hypothetical protein